MAAAASRKAPTIRLASGTSMGAGPYRPPRMPRRRLSSYRLGARQLLVADAVRPVRRVPEQFAAVLLVGLEVALEPRDLRVPFEGEHVRRHAVQEPAVVGDDHRAAGEGE